MADLNINLIGPASFGKDIKPTIKACLRCHERKVKCNMSDVPNGGSCKNCVKAKKPCQRYRDRRSRARSSDRSEKTSNTSSNPSPKLREPANTSAFQDYISTTIALQPFMDQSAHYVQPDINYALHPPEIGDLESFGFETSTMSTSTDQQDSPSDMRSEQRTDNPASERFEAFIADNLGAFAPRFVQQRNQKSHKNQAQDQPSNQLTSQVDVDLGSRSTIDIERQFINLDSADMDYLKAKNAFDLPPRQLQEDMVYAYFTHVNPVAPIINRTKFLREFQENKISSRLLLYAIFTAGCKACQNPLLMDQHGTKFGSGHRFYKITKALLDVGYEQDKLVQIQALLLITWWWDKKDDGGKNMRGCAINAISIAQSIGMSRWDQYPKNDPVLCGLWKRIWWGCVIRDATVSTSHGLPIMLDYCNFDVHPLTAEDFIEEEGLQPDTQTYPYSLEEVSFYIHEVKLAELLGVVHSAQYYMNRLHVDSTGSVAKREGVVHQNNPDVRRQYDRIAYSQDSMDEVGRICQEWYSTIPAELEYDVDDIQAHRFWPAYLHILFFTIVCTRHREKSVSKAVGAQALAKKHWSQAQGIAAATMITKIVRNMKAHGDVMKCTGFLTHSLFNSLIFCLIEGQSPDTETRNYAQQKYSLCLNSLYDFSQLWLSASLIHRLFESLQANMTRVNTVMGPRSTIFYTEYLPNTHISSEIGNETMKRLLASSLPSGASSRNDTGFVQQQETTLRAPDPSLSYFLDLDNLPPEFFEDNIEFPSSLNPQNWCDFFDLGKL